MRAFEESLAGPCKLGIGDVTDGQDVAVQDDARLAEVAKDAVAASREQHEAEFWVLGEVGDQHRDECTLGGPDDGDAFRW